MWRELGTYPPTLRQRGDPGGPNVITWTLKSREVREMHGKWEIGKMRQKGRSEKSKCEEDSTHHWDIGVFDNNIVVFEDGGRESRAKKCRWLLEAGNKPLPPHSSQQENEDLNPAKTRDWILPTAWWVWRGPWFWPWKQSGVNQANLGFWPTDLPWDNKCVVPELLMSSNSIGSNRKLTQRIRVKCCCRFLRRKKSSSLLIRILSQDWVNGNASTESPGMFRSSEKTSTSNRVQRDGRDMAAQSEHGSGWKPPYRSWVLQWGATDDPEFPNSMRWSRWTSSSEPKASWDLESRRQKGNDDVQLYTQVTGQELFIWV